VEHVTVPVPLAALMGALARAPAALGRGGAAAPPLSLGNEALQAFLEDFARDRLLLPGPHPALGEEVRIPPPPRDVAFRRLMLAAAAVVSDAAVAPAARLALATSGQKGLHVYRRLAQVAEPMVAHVDPALVFVEVARGEELVRRVAAAFRLTIEGEIDQESLSRLTAVDARAEAAREREELQRRREGEVRRAIAAAALHPEPWRLLPDGA